MSQLSVVVVDTLYRYETICYERKQVYVKYK